MEELTPDRLNRKQGILFMPNHPAHVDPLINFVWLWPKFQMRPLEIDHIYNLPLLKLINKRLKAISIPNFELAVNEYKVKQAEKSIGEIAAGLKRGENFIVYPAGRLKTTKKELLGGSSGAHELLRECPEANVVLIRTTGLWGSSFSRALIGRSPELGPTIAHALKVILKNLIFFTPRRKVLIEIEPNPAGMPRENGSRIELNRYLEGWYNRYPDDQGNISEREPLTLVSYSRWREELPEVHRPDKKRGSNGVAISEETRRKITHQIRKILDKPDLEVQPEMSLAYDLGMDSLNIAEFIAYLAKNFDVGELHPEDLESVESILEIAEGGAEARTQRGPPSSFTWPKEKGRLPPALPLGRTIPEAFLNSCERMGGYAAYMALASSATTKGEYFRLWKLACDRRKRDQIK